MKLAQSQVLNDALIFLCQVCIAFHPFAHTLTDIIFEVLVVFVVLIMVHDPILLRVVPTSVRLQVVRCRHDSFPTAKQRRRRITNSATIALWTAVAGTTHGAAILTVVSKNDILATVNVPGKTGNAVTLAIFSLLRAK
jgi:hypothetical protein